MKIREETLEKSQYFTTSGYDIWRAEPFAIIRMKNLVTGETQELIAGQECPFVPIRMPKITTKSKSNKNSKSKETEESPPPVERKMRKGKKSKYKGVSPNKPGRNGRVTWRAQIWDRKACCAKHLGSFEIEELAAAAAAEAKGEHVEAKRLWALAKQVQADLAEQAENNPDRPKSRKRKKIFECTHCHLEFKSRPDSCPQCRSASFVEVDDE